MYVWTYMGVYIFMYEGMYVIIYVFLCIYVCVCIYAFLYIANCLRRNKNKIKNFIDLKTFTIQLERGLI